MAALRLLLLGSLLVLALPVHATGASADSPHAHCQAADAALERGELEKAQKAYLDLLAAEPSSPCAVTGLNEVTVTTRSEERLCAEGKALAAAEQKKESRQRYAAALRLNTGSACATKGLAPAEDKTKEEVKEWAELIPQVLLALGAILAALMVVLAIGFLVWTVVTRLIKPSLRIKPFADGGVEPKVGAAVASMVETRLHELSGRPGSGYLLDLVVADVELFAAEDDLSSAMGSFAEVPQLSLFVALLSGVERLAGRRAFIAGGDLVPAGEGGAGVALAVHRHNRLHARRTIWAPPRLSPPPDEEPDSAADFYELVVPTAAWLQYEVAAGLDEDVPLLTQDADSWSRLGVALSLEREGEVVEAVIAYGEAIAIDPDNVGALANLGVLVAREFGLYEMAMVLILHARKVVRRRQGMQT